MKTQLYPVVSETPKPGLGIFGIIALGVIGALIIMYIKNRKENGETQETQ